MLRGMARLVTKSDVLRPAITLLVCALLGGIMWEVLHWSRARWVGPVLFGGIFLVVAFSTARGLYVRTMKLLNGRCPHPLCHGTVQHSERAPRGFLRCPTCGHQWPEIEGIKFRVTGRDHA
jgi:hypothetical protein